MHRWQRRHRRQQKQRSASCYAHSDVGSRHRRSHARAQATTEACGGTNNGVSERVRE
jgi:hypothetical protein